VSVQIESIVLGGGCFWCLDAGYRLIEGIESVTSGFAGGQMQNPTYYDVTSGKTGHAEVVKVDFDSKKISLEDVLDIFWAMHDPTTKDRQGNDVGSQYRSTILYTDEGQLDVIKKSIESITLLWDDPIVTEVKKLATFYPAEEEHQNYFQKNPERGYCQVIINPKLAKLRAKFTERVKN
jgi:peptide-methionine (S)-S-oxide reductase